MCAEAPPGISANQWYRGTFDGDMFCLLKPREPTVRELRPKGLIPELLRGQSLQFDLPSLGVPVGHVGVQVGLERLEVGPLPAP